MKSGNGRSGNCEIANKSTIDNHQIENPDRPVRRFRSRRFVDVLTSAAAPKFYVDDPVWIERDTQEASAMKPPGVNRFVEFTYNPFQRPKVVGIQNLE